MPHLICIGAQRAATTWLYQSLRSYLGDICDPGIKEVHYFNQVWLPEQREWCIPHRLFQTYEAIQYMTSTYTFDILKDDEITHNRFRRLLKYYRQDVSDSWYRNSVMSNSLGTERLTLDFTPEYALLPDRGITHMMALCPSAKLVFVLRNPIIRAFSHLLKLNNDEGISLAPDSISEYMLRYPDITTRSDYADTIKSYSRVYGDGALHLIYDFDISADPLAVIQRLVEILGLKSRYCDEDAFRTRVHVSTSKQIYSREDVANLKRVLWKALASCYNKYESVSLEVSRRWRDEAEVFLDKLALG